MEKYVWRKGGFVDRDGNPMEIPERDGLCVPTVIPDIPAYQSPIDGAYVSGRAARRYDLEKHNCVLYDEAFEPVSKKGFKNERFAQKYNLPQVKEKQ